MKGNTIRTDPLRLIPKVHTEMSSLTSEFIPFDTTQPVPTRMIDVTDKKHHWFTNGLILFPPFGSVLDMCTLTEMPFVVYAQYERIRFSKPSKRQYVGRRAQAIKIRKSYTSWFCFHDLDSHQERRDNDNTLSIHRSPSNFGNRVSCHIGKYPSSRGRSPVTTQGLSFLAQRLLCRSLMGEYTLG